MTSYDKLVTRVASAIEVHEGFYPGDGNDLQAMARAAIAVCMEEAAKVALEHGHGPTKQSRQASVWDIAAAIRALNPKER